MKFWGVKGGVELSGLITLITDYSPHSLSQVPCLPLQIGSKLQGAALATISICPSNTYSTAEREWRVVAGEGVIRA